MLIQRRTFLQTGTLATASLMVPQFLKAFESGDAVPPGNKVVVVLQLSGGNDGLNTVIPVRNDVYYKERPRLGIRRDKALRLTDDAGLHPSLTAFADAYGNGSLGILNGVGYPNPDRSHFRSMDIWHSASAADQYVATGWVGRYLDAQCSGCAKPTHALEIDDVLSLSMKGERAAGLAFKDPKRLYGSGTEKFFKDIIAAQHAAEHEAPVDYLYKALSETVSSADYIFAQSKRRPSTAAYPASDLGRNLKTVASLIFSDIHTKVYYLSLGSFDTHIFQQGQHSRLLAEMNDAVGAFIKDLKANNRFDDVLLFTFSEFGRRVAQNGSGGTDHGTANNMFFLSGGLKQKGLLNALPDLKDLDNGDLKHTVDFKNVYATVLRNWLGADDTQVLGGKYERLGFV